MRALKVIFETLGIKINPDEVEAAWEQSKDALPKLAASFNEMNERLARIEAKINAIQNDVMEQGKRLCQN